MSTPFDAARSRTLSRRHMLRMLGSAAVAAPVTGALGACGSGSGTSGGSTTKSLTFTYMGTASQQAQWNQLFAQFSKKYPNIKLKPQAVAGNNWGTFFNKVSTQIAGGQTPDIIQIATEGQRLFASKGLLEPLDPYIARDKSVIDSYYADLNPNLIKWNKEHSSPDGKTYYLPGEFNTMAMWCNKDLFAKAGVDLPAEGADWTWEEFRSACQKIKAATGAFGYAAQAAYFVGIMPWLLTNGTSSFNADWSQPTFNTPAAVEAAEFNRSLVADKLSPPPGGTFDAATTLAQGKLAMFGGGRWPVIDERKLGAIDKITIVKWPIRVKAGSPVGWNGYPILKASQHKDDAWTFIKFLISKEGTSFFAKLGGTIVPARKSVAASQDYLADSPAGTPLLYDALSYATPVPSPDKGAEVQKTIEDAWQQVLAGNTPPPSALGQAQQKLQTLV
jgi:multiple sugar transport system substrate-binding protein